MDGEMIAGLTHGYTKQDQAWKGLEVALKYYAVDSTNILVNRALADAYFIDRHILQACATPVSTALIRPITVCSQHFISVRCNIQAVLIVLEQ